MYHISPIMHSLVSRMRASTRASTVAVDNEEDKDDDLDYRVPGNIAPQDYISTTLVGQFNVTLADVDVKVYSEEEVTELEQQLGRTLNELADRVQIIDPLARMREANR